MCASIRRPEKGEGHGTSTPPRAPIFARDTANYELHESVARRKRDHLIEKKLPSAYAGTGLADWLAKNAVDTLSVTGYMTHNCVASTVIHALHAGLAVEVLSDATGSLPCRAGRCTATTSSPRTRKRSSLPGERGSLSAVPAGRRSSSRCSCGRRRRS
jgi:nicotinamidase-related amidase